MTWTKLLAQNRPAHPVAGLLSGILLGYTLGRMGFASWHELHAMFTLREPRLIVSFGGAVLLLIPFYRWAERRTYMTPAVLSRATVVGSLLFGAGWAIGGICPGSGLVQLGHGTLMTLLTLAGMCTGMWSYPVVQRRLFPGSPSSGCDG